MIEVSKERFFQAIGAPLNVHPRSEKHVTHWEEVGTRRLIGQSEPGYLEPGKPKKWFLAEDFA